MHRPWHCHMIQGEERTKRIKLKEIYRYFIRFKVPRHCVQNKFRRRLCEFLRRNFIRESCHSSLQQVNWSRCGFSMYFLQYLCGVYTCISLSVTLFSFLKVFDDLSEKNSLLNTVSSLNNSMQLIYACSFAEMRNFCSRFCFRLQVCLF